jgi:hypothetical protein
MSSIPPNRAKNWTLSSAAALMLLAGCSGENPSAASATNTKAAAPATQMAAAKTPAVGSRSVFTVDPKLRDPFFPGSTRRAAATTSTTPAVAAPMDIPALLQAGFDGVVGAGESRIAIINNVLLERGRTATIPLTAGGQRREVTVRVREVLPNAVVLEVQGQRQPITIRRPQR